MTEKIGYIGGIGLGLILYGFTSEKIFGWALSTQAQNLLEFFIPLLSIFAVIIVILRLFGKIRVPTTERGVLFGTVATVLVLKLGIGTLFPDLL